jgi:hypothetical protein
MALYSVTVMSSRRHRFLLLPLNQTAIVAGARRSPTNNQRNYLYCGQLCKVPGARVREEVNGT